MPFVPRDLWLVLADLLKALTKSRSRMQSSQLLLMVFLFLPHGPQVFWCPLADRLGQYVTRLKSVSDGDLVIPTTPVSLSYLPDTNNRTGKIQPVGTGRGRRNDHDHIPITLETVFSLFIKFDQVCGGITSCISLTPKCRNAQNGSQVVPCAVFNRDSAPERLASGPSK